MWIKNSTCEQIGREVLTIWFLNENVPKSEKNRIIYENLKPKVLVIGSSRIMQISNDNFNQQILENLL